MEKRQISLGESISKAGRFGTFVEGDLSLVKEGMGDFIKDILR